MLVMNQLRGHINQLFILIKMLVESVFSLLFDGYFTLGAPPAVGRFLPGIRQDQSSDVCKVGGVVTGGCQRADGNGAKCILATWMWVKMEDH